jgi:hypothetical protein
MESQLINDTVALIIPGVRNTHLRNQSYDGRKEAFAFTHCVHRTLDPRRNMKKGKPEARLDASFWSRRPLID